MSWFKIDDGFHCHPKVLAAGTPAVGLYVRCGSWAAQQVTDGIVPKQIAKAYGTSRMAKALVDAGLWHEKGHECETCPELDANSYAIHQYLDRNPSRVDVELARKAKTDRQQRWRDGKKKAQANDGMAFDVDGDVDASTGRHSDAAPVPSRPDPTPTTSSNEEVGDSPRSEIADEPELTEPTRHDIERVCRALADAVEANGSKRPTITRAWRTAARLMIDKDGRTPDQILACITWCQSDAFWRGNVLAMPKLREKYDQLRLAAQRQNGHQPGTGLTLAGASGPSRPSVTDQRVRDGLALADRLRAKEAAAAQLQRETS